MDGKQIKKGTITEDKIASLPTTPSSQNAPASKAYVDAQLSQSVNNQDWNASCRVASASNINLESPGVSIDGIALNIGDRVLLYAQNNASQNWIYIWNGALVLMTRALDADGNTEVTSQAAVSIEEGSVLNVNKSFRITTSGIIILGTTPIVVAGFVTFLGSNPSISNKFMEANTTAIDGDVACTTPVITTPNAFSFVGVDINGDRPEIGNGVKTKDCYFSGDSGATARLFTDIVATDKLHWNGTIAGYQLAITDKISFEYNA